MSFFPKRADNRVTRTGMMNAARKRTFDAHGRGRLIVWSGSSHVGKTTTARWLEKTINKKYDSSNPDAFKADRYEAAEFGRQSGGHTKKALRALHHATQGRMDTGVFRSKDPADMANDIVHGLKRRRREMIFIDEANRYSAEALEALAMVLNKAVDEEVGLSLVLIGMADLEMTISREKQLDNRVNEWICFEPPSLEETFDLLQIYSTHFSESDLEDPITREMVEWIHERHDGLPGLVQKFIEKVDKKIGRREMSLGFLNSVYKITAKDRARINGQKGEEENEDVE